jgi:hypothetical protein
VVDDIETEQDNARWRISESGPGAECVRHWILAKLEPRMKAFCAHASVADLIALVEALELREEVDQGNGRATLVEAFLKVLGIESGAMQQQRGIH